MRVLVAGVGNVLRADDAFGVEVSRRLDALDLPDSVKVVETGIGGMALVQQLQDGYDALIVADAVDLGRAPGTIMLIDPEVVDVGSLSTADRHEALQDSHLVTPGKVFMLARALGVLPANLLLVGCQPQDAESVAMEMSAPVAAAVEVAVAEILRHLTELGALEGWDRTRPDPAGPDGARTSPPGGAGPSVAKPSGLFDASPPDGGRAA